MFEHEILRLRCAQGAPLPNWDAGAEMKELGKSEAVCPTVEDPNTEKDQERTKPTQHTGQGSMKCEMRTKAFIGMLPLSLLAMWMPEHLSGALLSVSKVSICVVSVSFVALSKRLAMCLTT